MLGALPVKGARTASSIAPFVLIGLSVLSALAILRYFGGIGSHWFPVTRHGDAPTRRHGAPETPPIAPGITQLFLNSTQTAGPYPLDLTCFDSGGSPLSCSPSWCSAKAQILATANTRSCALTSTAIDYASRVAALSCRVCTQSSDARCTSAALAATFGSQRTVFAAFCNDKYMVSMNNKASSGVYNLDNIPNPPGGTDASGTCVTRTESVTAAFAQDHIPLVPTLLPTSALTNNYGFYKGVPNGQNGPLFNSQTSTTYWLSASGRIGITLSGQELCVVQSSCTISCLFAAHH